MALGLLVGVAALGVISTRAVVERRQQIGVLRAIGYQKSMVGWSFVLESSFIALLGILIGVGLGLVLSFNFVQFIAADTPTVRWSVPWLQIGGIVLLAYVVSLLTTIMPARQAAQIYPAEALRYE
jgi:putative ABC transport system permease protein